MWFEDMESLHGWRLVFWWIHVENGGDQDSEGIGRMVQTKSTDKLGSDTVRGELMTLKEGEGEDTNATPDAQHHGPVFLRSMAWAGRTTSK